MYNYHNVLTLRGCGNQEDTSPKVPTKICSKCGGPKILVRESSHVGSSKLSTIVHRCIECFVRKDC